MHAIVLIGSNISPSENVRRSIELLSQRVTISRLSAAYVTDAMGRPRDPKYFNCAVAIETPLSADALRREVLRPIEEQLGRVRSADKYSPRPIDLDLVLYGNGSVENRTLFVSGSDLLERAFLAIPLAELEPGLLIPGEGIPLGEAVKRLPAIERLDEYSAALHSAFDPRRENKNS